MILKNTIQYIKVLNNDTTVAKDILISFPHMDNIVIFYLYIFWSWQQFYYEPCISELIQVLCSASYTVIYSLYLMNNGVKIEQRLSQQGHGFLFREGRHWVFVIAGQTKWSLGEFDRLTSTVADCVNAHGADMARWLMNSYWCGV